MKAILNTRKDIIDAVATNQETGLRYGTGMPASRTRSSPGSLCNRFRHTLTDARVKAIKKTYLLIVRFCLTNSSVNHNFFGAKSSLRLSEGYAPCVYTL